MNALQLHHSIVARRRAAAPPGSFSPADIGGLVLWLKADSISGADGDNLGSTTWQDSSSANNDVILSGGVTLQTNELNGKPCVRFGAAGSGASPLVLLKPYTIFLVEKSAANSDSRSISSQENNRLISNGRTGIQAYVENVVAGASPVTAPVYSCLRVPGSGTCTFFQFGVDVNFGNTAAPLDWGTLCLGSGFNPELPFSDIFEVFAYDSSLSPTNRGLVETYLATEYAL